MGSRYIIIYLHFLECYLFWRTWKIFFSSSPFFLREPEKCVLVMKDDITPYQDKRKERNIYLTLHFTGQRTASDSSCRIYVPTAASHIFQHWQTIHTHDFPNRSFQSITCLPYVAFPTHVSSNSKFHINWSNDCFLEVSKIQYVGVTFLGSIESPFTK